MMKKTRISILLATLMLFSIGCQEEKNESEIGEKSKYKMSYVVSENFSLPYFESKQKLNSTPEGELRSQLSLYDNDTNESYILIDNDGNIMEDEEFARVKSRSFAEENELIKKIKNYPLFIVKEDMYFITTLEEEVDALFNGERDIIDKDRLDNIIELNADAYENKDYEAINNYLMKNDIKAWKPIWGEK